MSLTDTTETSSITSEPIGSGDGSSSLSCVFNKHSSTTYKLDDSLAYEVVEELEDWKEKQQHEFMAALVAKEMKHLTFLSTEWDKKRNSIERQLDEGMTKCDDLASQLLKAREASEEISAKNKETEQNMQHVSEEVMRYYDAKIMALQEAARRVEEDLMHKIELSDTDQLVMQERLNALKVENSNLREKRENLHKKTTEIRKTALRKDQISNLIYQLKSNENKLAEVAKTKSYFKDQWAKSVRQVHKFKSDKQKSMSNHLQKYKSMIDRLPSSNADSFGLDQKLQDIQTQIQDIHIGDSHSSVSSFNPYFTNRSQPNLLDCGEKFNISDSWTPLKHCISSTAFSCSQSTITSPVESHSNSRASLQDLSSYYKEELRDFTYNQSEDKRYYNDLLSTSTHSIGDNLTSPRGKTKYSKPKSSGDLKRRISKSIETLV